MELFFFLKKALSFERRLVTTTRRSGSNVKQSLLIAEIYQHSITSTTLTWLRPPRPSHGLRCEIVWVCLVFCVLYVNKSLLIAEIYINIGTTLTWLRPP